MSLWCFLTMLLMNTINRHIVMYTFHSILLHPVIFKLLILWIVVIFPHKMGERFVKNKNTWVTNTSTARELSFGTYSRIRMIEHLVNNCSPKLCSWKYWNYLIINDTGFEIFISNYIYLEFTDGNINSDQKYLQPVKFWTP